MEAHFRASASINPTPSISKRHHFNVHRNWLAKLLTAILISSIPIIMGIQIPLYKKEILIPNSRIERDSHEIPGDYQLIPFYAVIMIPNFIGTISKAIRRNENSFVMIFVVVYVGFVLSRFFLSKYVSLPKNEKLMQQMWLKLDIWFLYTVITFGFVYQFADFSPLQTTVAMYMVVSVCSLVLLFVFVIVDVIEFWKIWRYGEDHETQLSENQMTDAGKLNSYSVSIWEKV